jgi:hypothetical protein
MSAPKNGRPRPRAAQRKPRLRLLKVLVQPVFVLDDGETVREVTQQGATEVVGGDWEAWAATAYSADRLAGLCKELHPEGAE